jgi:hypothetical protein
MTTKIENGNLIVTIPISPRPSASGKTTVVASSNGNHATTCIYEGRPIVVGINAYIPKN